MSLIWVAPLTIGALAWIYWRLSSPAVEALPARGGTAAQQAVHARSWTEIVLTGSAIGIALAVNWFAFWILAVLILGRVLWQASGMPIQFLTSDMQMRLREWFFFEGAILAAIIVTLGVSRSDLDDAFYVSIAAGASAHPHAPLLAEDPMHGQPGVPLLFPSYRFASYELLIGAIGHLTGISAMTIAYKVLPIGSATLAIVAIFLLAQALLPRRWLWLALGTLLLIMILGETHRAPANMMFVRLFQGKAVCLTIVLPAIFYLTLRCFSRTSSARDIFLLGCAEVSAIGLTNFGMLAALMANALALGAAVPVWREVKPQRIASIFVTMALPLPYLVATAMQAEWGDSLSTFGHERPADVWVTVLGHRQQFLIGTLLCIGPLLTSDPTTRWRLALPPFMLLAVFLNPLWSEFLAAHITTPPVYWRVMWSFPMLVFAAAALVLLGDRLLSSAPSRMRNIVIPVVLLVVVLAAMPGFTIRASNIGQISTFPAEKIPVVDLEVARRAAAATKTSGSLLAPDEIAGVVSRFEHHPRLVSVRDMYLNLLAASFGVDAYRQRSVLHSFVSGRNSSSQAEIVDALKSLQVSTIVINHSTTTDTDRAILLSAGFKVDITIGVYHIWRRTEAWPE